MPDRSQPPAAKSPEKFLLPKVSRYDLDNGIPVHVLAFGELPTVKIEFIFRAGTRFESVAGMSFFTMKMLAEGTKSHNSKEISAFFDQYGVFIENQSGPDYATIELLMVERHIPEILPRVFDIIYSPSFPDDELELLKMIQRQHLAVNLEKNSYLAATLVREKLYGKSHPYGRSLTHETIDLQHRDSLQSFYEMYIPGNFEIVLSGKVTDRTIEALNNLFSSIGKYEPRTFKWADSRCTRTRVRKRREKELQATIRLAQPIPGRHHHDYTQIFVVNELLGGYFGSRLMQNIREEKGYTYGIYSSLINQKSGAHLVIGTDVKKQFVDETLVEIRKEMTRLQHEPVKEEELRTVINYIKGAYLSGITTPFSIAEKFKTIHFYDLESDYYDRLFDRLDAVTPEPLQRAAQQFFNPDEMTEVVVG
jgi:predicted Zn-dependent peptidase